LPQSSGLRLLSAAIGRLVDRQCPQDLGTPADAISTDVTCATVSVHAGATITARG
jgi:hypothetical protein